MLCHPNGADRLNCFALVAYIPEPLAQFLDSLRKEMVSGCKPHAHVTVLPPRPISGTVEEAGQLAQSLAADFPPFEIAIGDVEIFPVTEVVYLGIRAGVDRLLPMHEAMNIGPLEFHEPFPYHPHITLAQELQPGQSARLAEVARRRWSEFAYPKRFPVETLTFVQNTVENTWVDLVECHLAAVPVR
ncbi:MAG: 2'-5' RNA ligase family protein [Acidobacteria bacterium]|nr:2'-5' RNA ligase family protein [Acidobacteriota bacterium]MBI3470924.1 2'-5' RNA ligase family protein [Candidatus Solibacter usitatus]